MRVLRTTGMGVSETVRAVTSRHHRQHMEVEACLDPTNHAVAAGAQTRASLPRLLNQVRVAVTGADLVIFS